MKPLKPLNTNPANWRYRGLIGTGGIGSGAFFALAGNHTLGREESRAGRFFDRRDYCKLHIITHYVQALLGKPFETIAIGKVGDDEAGRQVVEEMKEAGLVVDLVAQVPGEQTLYSLCFSYPDGTGGNLTVNDSASTKVDAQFVRLAEPDFARFTGAGITLAAPEVPLDARAELLRLGRAHRFFNTASFTSGEFRDASAKAREMLAMVDLLAINLDEAATFAGVDGDKPREEIAQRAIDALLTIQPSLQCAITAGGSGSWTWDGQSLSFLPAHKVEVVGTAGAGDSFFSGLIVGIAAGLPLAEAQQLATLIGALKVTCVHTINKHVDRETLRTLAKTTAAPLTEPVRLLLEE